MTAQPSGAARGERQGSTAAASGTSTSALTTLAPAITQTGGSAEADARLNSEYATQRTWEHRMTRDRKSTRLNSSHRCISYAVFCLKKKKNKKKKKIDKNKKKGKTKK